MEKLLELTVMNGFPAISFYGMRRKLKTSIFRYRSSKPLCWQWWHTVPVSASTQWIRSGIPGRYRKRLVGSLYHEHGRRILGKNKLKEDEYLKPEQWNNYEILAVGHRIWLAINGKVTVSLRDPVGELDGQISLQIHGGILRKLSTATSSWFVILKSKCWA